MIVSRRVVRGILPFSFAIACASALAGCDTVTYGTGTGPLTQTVQDIAAPLNIFNLNPQGIDYTQPRPAELATPTDATLPPPTEGGATNTQPQQQPTTPQDNLCGAGPLDPAPPAADCTPNPNAPAVAQQPGGLLGGIGAATATGIRALIDPCQWGLVAWSQMNRTEQDAWGRLGWDASNWGSTNTALWPASAGQLWGDLRLRERRAAESLGFTAETWNGCYLP
jgi:hypothetical protein